MLKTTQLTRLTPESHKTLLTILETLPEALFVLDDAATILYANASAQALTGVAPEILVGNTFWRSAPQLVSTALYQAVCETKQTRALTEVQYVSPVTGTWLQVHLSPTLGGLTLHFHEMGGPAHRQEIVPERESLYMDVLNTLHAGFMILTPEGIVLDLNEVPLDDAQIRREEIVGKSLVEDPWWFFSPASQAQFRAAIARANKGETVRFGITIHPREGMEIHLEEAITPHLDAKHHVDYLVMVAIDITARKRAEAEIHALIDAIPQLVWTMRPDGYVDYHNQRWCDYTGLSPEETQGDGWIQCLHPEDRQRVRSMRQRAIQGDGVCETEMRLRHGTTGTYRWFLARALPVRDDAGQIVKWFGTSTDIEEQKQAAERIKTSEQNWRILAETVPQLVWMTSPEGLVEYWNQRWYDYTGSSPEQASGHGWSQFLHSDDYQHTLRVWHHALASGEAYEIEYRLKEGQTGGYRWFLARGMPVRDEAGQILKWFGTCTDIEEQKQTEQRLKESEERFRVLAETVPQLVWVTRPNGQHEYTNQHWCDYTGLTLKQIQSDRWDQLPFMHPDDWESNRACIQHALETGAMYEHEQRLRNAQTGEYRWFLVRALPMRDEAGQIVRWFGTCTDIEDQKRIEKALRESQERIRALIDSNIIGIVSVEGEKEALVEGNDAWVHMTGYTREEMRSGAVIREKIISPEQAPLFEHARQELLTYGQHTPFEVEVKCKDGSYLPVLVGGVLFQEQPRQIISFVLDNSARKELERRKDAFISMASHELKNPLAALKMQASLLHRQLTKQGTQDQLPALARMEAQINKVNRLVEELLDVSKIQAGRLEYRQETVDLDALLREIAETMQQTHPSHRILVRGAVQINLLGDRDRLGQVFTNLISNAIKYSPDAQTVEMDLSASAETVTIRVTDHGLGIPREQRDKIFERFYRVTGPKQKAIPGLGMGLYIVAEIVKHHGGTITVESEVGKGSTFTVTLPTR
ncbi:PAS domain-containing sensor histidine kinase [Ktedonobacter robiniae]|uniref:histidine kinase n=1 Tax=Ktedonobacter robiniae TaxID=2778365 RepID=A0ABQ3V0L8_9CHLR|nr:PAS domain-containing sensor histidine kinase [Ktedonobacter robiniae]GHO58664.1 hypothetical protein KSB_71390 [Ktedonobacter robiniae]